MNTSTVVAPKVKVSKFSKLFIQTYKRYSSLMKQSYGFDRFLLRYRELNDTQQALFSSSLLCNRQRCTPNDVRTQAAQAQDVNKLFNGDIAVFWAVTQRSPQKERLLTSEPHSFPIVFAACLRAIEQANHIPAKCE